MQERFGGPTPPATMPKCDYLLCSCVVKRFISSALSARTRFNSSGVGVQTRATPSHGKFVMVVLPSFEHLFISLRFFIDCLSELLAVAKFEPVVVTVVVVVVLLNELELVVVVILVGLAVLLITKLFCAEAGTTTAIAAVKISAR